MICCKLGRWDGTNSGAQPYSDTLHHCNIHQQLIFIQWSNKWLCSGSQCLSKGCQTSPWLCTTCWIQDHNFLNNTVSDIYTIKLKLQLYSRGNKYCSDKESFCFFTGYIELTGNNDIVMNGESGALANGTYLQFKENVGYNGGAKNILLPHSLLQHNTVLCQQSGQKLWWCNTLRHIQSGLTEPWIWLLCYILYYVDPNKWTVNETSKNNSVSTSGSAVYSSYIGFISASVVITQQSFAGIHSASLLATAVTGKWFHLRCSTWQHTNTSLCVSEQRQALSLSVFDRNMSRLNRANSDS